MTAEQLTVCVRSDLKESVDGEDDTCVEVSFFTCPGTMKLMIGCWTQGVTGLTLVFLMGEKSHDRTQRNDSNNTYTVYLYEITFQSLHI